MRGQAEAALTTPRYDPCLKRACAEWALKLRDRNYGYRIARGGGIIDRELGTADSLVIVSESFDEAEEFSGLFAGRPEVANDNRNFELNISL